MEGLYRMHENSLKWLLPYNTPKLLSPKWKESNLVKNVNNCRLKQRICFKNQSLLRLSAGTIIRVGNKGTVRPIRH